MNIPRAVWTLIGIAALALSIVVWLHGHDRRVRETAALATVVDAKNDTIRVLNADLVSLGKAAKATDDAYAAATGAVIRVAYVPRALRDSIAVLSRSLALAMQRGDATVPIATAMQFDGQLHACRGQVDKIVAAVGSMARDCERRVATRDSVIAVERQIVRQMQDKLDATATLAGVSRPRLAPFIAADYSPLRKQWNSEIGARLRLFSGLTLRATAGYRDSLDVRVGGEWDFK